MSVAPMAAEDGHLKDDAVEEQYPRKNVMDRMVVDMSTNSTRRLRCARKEWTIITLNGEQKQY